MSDPTWREALDYVTELIAADNYDWLSVHHSPIAAAQAMKSVALTRIDETRIIMEGREGE